MPRFDSVEQYLAAAPEDQRRALAALRKQIKAAVPAATESVSYGVPTYKLDGKPVIYFASWARHCSIYGVPTDALPPAYQGHIASKGTIQFSPDKPLPAAVVTKLVEARLAALKKGGASY